MSRSKSFVYFIFILLVVLAFIILYNSDINNNKRILLNSSKNKNQFEFVLSYFNNTKEDTLKYKAAKFLINNIDDDILKNKIIKNENHNIALNLLNTTAEKQLYLGFDKKPQKKEAWRENNYVKIQLDSLVKNIVIENSHSVIIPNSKKIKSIRLINHIERAFDKWSKSKLIEKSNFEEFTETLLRYRYNTEHLNTSYKYPKKIWENLLKDIDIKDIKAVINILKDYFYRVDRLTAGINYKFDLGFYDILKWGKLSCNKQSIIAAEILNDIGIPTYIDTTPLWLNRSLGHTWCVSKDSLGNYLPFSPFWQSIDTLKREGIFNKNYFKRVSKVYRKTYASQEKSAIMFKHKNEVIPSFFNTTHLKDVTDKYHKTTSLNINLKKFDYEKNNLVYLAVFSPKGWIPVAWSKVDAKKKKAFFDKIPKEVVYVVGIYNGFEIEPLTSAFYLDSKNVQHNIKSNLNKLITMKLLEKYPEKERLIDFRKERINGKFQGADNERFMNAEDLYKFSRIPKNYVENLNIKNNKSYRYVRFIPKESISAGMAIIEFYEKKNSKDSLIKGTKPYILNPKDTSLQVYKNLSKLQGILISNNKKAKFDRLNKGFDGNMETYAIDKWIGLDFGTPKKIASIRYAARNANNRINAGDVYKLYYYNKGWIYFGIKKAKYNFLIFDNVPSGTMYWLKNISKGKEELPFVYFNNKQFFVNHDYLNDSYFKK